MSLTNFNFFVFLLVILFIYYIFKPIQKYILLFASIYFYIKISSVKPLNLIILIFLVFFVTYIGAITIEHVRGKWKTLILTVCILCIISNLFILKYAYNIVNIINYCFRINHNYSWLQFASVIGISYYSLSAIGYLLDVYWQTYGAERNPFNVGLFIFYFPQLISGPLTKYSNMSKQFNTKKFLKYENITKGLRRMLWGYFKKLVISERFGIVVTGVYGDCSELSFLSVLFATLCYAIQLYTDFSGCMDIVIGTSLLFGIELPENFKAPFFSESIQEFWQRWHITLGTWFKDYVMYPTQKSAFVQNIGKNAKKILGKKYGKKVPFIISMLFLWFLIGIWHGGTGYYFIASAVIPFLLLMIGDLTNTLSDKIVKFCKVDTNCESWRFLRRIRTLLLVCICWIFACSNGTFKAINIFKQMFSRLYNFSSLEESFNVLGLTSVDILIMSLSIILLYYSDKLIYTNSSIFKMTDKQNWFFRLFLIYAEILIIMFYGQVGSSAFIYFQF